MLNIGDVYLVEGPDSNSKVPALVVDIRKNDTKGQNEYYMHFKNLDHRLDNWVCIDQIDIDSGPQCKELYQSETQAGSTDERLTRLQKKKKGVEDVQTEPYDSSGVAEDIKKLSNPILPPIKSISCIQFGAMEIECWYVSKYPDEIIGEMPLTKLWICQFCLFYMAERDDYIYHIKNCKYRQPPGIEIYRKGVISVYEVDGKIYTLYCQNLCLMSKLFLDHKAVYFDVEPFLFYILTYVNKEGAHFIGYFSKEKNSIEGNNLACLLVLPPFQKHGFGNFLIELSYELSKIEGAVGRPEKPLSDLGLASYRKYWCKTLLKTIKLHGQNLSIKELSKLTSITQEDILSTLKGMNMTKYWKCKHVICVSSKQLDEALSKITNSSTNTNNDYREKSVDHNLRPLAETDNKNTVYKPLKFLFDSSYLRWKTRNAPSLIHNT